MRKIKEAPKTRLISASVSEPTYDLVLNLIKRGFAQSVSDVVRQGIVMLHAKKFQYNKLEKEKKESEKDRILDMSPEDYCNNVIYGIPGEKDGKLVCFLPGSQGALADLNIIKTFSEDEFKFVDPLLSLPVSMESVARQIPRMKMEKEALKRLSAYEKGTDEYHQKLKKERELIAVWLAEYDAEKGSQSTPSVDPEDPFNLKNIQ